MVDQGTAMGVVGAAGAAAYGITWAVRRQVDLWEKRQKCPHDLYLDDRAREYIYWKYRCRNGCGHQEDAAGEIAAERERREALWRAAAVQRCPKCGGGL